MIGIPSGLRLARKLAGGSQSGVRPRNVLRIPDAASSLGDLVALNSNRLERLKRDRKGQYSIRINDQWRICFEWPKNDPGPSDVEIVDYH